MRKLLGVIAALGLLAMASLTSAVASPATTSFQNKNDILAQAQLSTASQDIADISAAKTKKKKAMKKTAKKKKKAVKTKRKGKKKAMKKRGKKKTMKKKPAA